MWLGGKGKRDDARGLGFYAKSDGKCSLDRRSGGKELSLEKRSGGIRVPLIRQ